MILPIFMINLSIALLFPFVRLISPTNRFKNHDIYVPCEVFSYKKLNLFIIDTILKLIIWELLCLASLFEDWKWLKKIGIKRQILYYRWQKQHQIHSNYLTKPDINSHERRQHDCIRLYHILYCTYIIISDYFITFYLAVEYQNFLTTGYGTVHRCKNCNIVR